jgi:hypothetical protein
MRQRDFYRIAASFFEDDPLSEEVAFGRRLPVIVSSNGDVRDKTGGGVVLRIHYTVIRYGKRHGRSAATRTLATNKNAS